MDKRTIKLKKQVKKLVQNHCTDNNITLSEFATQHGFKPKNFLYLLGSKGGITTSSLMELLDTINYELVIQKKEGL